MRATLVFLLLPLLLLVCPTLSLSPPYFSNTILFYGLSPTCGPSLSFSILTLNATGFLDEQNNVQNFTISVGGTPLDPSYILAVLNNSVSFLLSKDLTPGTYPIQLCSSIPIYNCTQSCSLNCTNPLVPTSTPLVPTSTPTPYPYNSSTTGSDDATPLTSTLSVSGDDNSTTNCTQTCVDQCVPLPSCSTLAQYVAYNIPPILLSLSPTSVATRSSQLVTVTGQHFMSCGAALTVRIQTPTSYQDVPATFNSSTEIVFATPSSLSAGTGIVSVSLDGQHFDSLSASPITLTVVKGGAGGSSSDSDSFSASESENPPNKPSLTWLYVVLGVVAVAAGAFLVYVIYRLKVKDDYSRLYDL